MPSDASLVRFPANANGRPPADALVVRVPRGIVTKDRLFDVLAEGLRLPAYFGRNWDALEECLRTLEWLDSPRAIVLQHADVPFRPRSRLRHTYLDVLRKAVQSWPPGDKHELIISFPRWAAATLRAIERISDCPAATPESAARTSDRLRRPARPG